jgi:ABC-type branched-subunit amino acid transport system substrate-binding protein
MNPTKLARLLAVLLAFAMLAAACGRDDDDDGDTAADDTTDTVDDDSDADDDDGEDEPAGDPEPAPGFDGETIRLGVLTPLTDRVAIIGVPLTNGTQAWIDAVNAEGGIAGKYQLELVIEDTKYDAPTAVQLYNGMKDDVTMFAQILGTPIVNAVLAQLQGDNIVGQPATLDADWLREQNLLPVGAPYQIQVINGMDYYINELGSAEDTMCWTGTDDPYGEAGMEGMEFAAEELGFEIAAQPTFATTDTEFTAPINALAGAGCDVVFGTFTAASLTGLLGAAVQQGFSPVWLGQSPSWLSIFSGTPLKDYLEANFYLVAEGPAWGDESVPAMADMIADLEAHTPDQAPDGYFVFGYAAARAVTQVLERAVEMGDLSREGIVEAMNSMEEIDLGGLFGPYTWGAPEDRDPPRGSTIFRIVDGQPNGVELVDQDYTSEAAEAFTFDG